MVHALEESWRVLKKKGFLIDMRPISQNRPVAVIAGNQVELAGMVDDSGGIPDEKAANRAISMAVSRGMFSKCVEQTFDYEYYWDSLEGMQDYIEDTWSDFGSLPQQILERAEQIAAKYDRETLCYRVQSRVQIDIYQKLTQGLVTGDWRLAR